MRASYPSRTSGPATFRTPSPLPFQRRLRQRSGRTQTAGTTGVAWTLMIDWDGDGFGTTPEDDVTDDALSPAALIYEYGRDQARSLAPLTSGRASGELDNVTRRYSPDNTGSVLSGRIVPSRPLRMQGRLDGVTYTLFRGYLDDYMVQAHREDRSVQYSGIDALGKLKDAVISTGLYSSVRTGTAIGHVLDAIGWPDDLRDLDVGATVIRWWWLHEEDAFKAISDLVASEGPGALLTADETGRIVFRDRHHRLLTDASQTAQATFAPGTDLVPQDFTLDLGWKDIINTVAIKVDEADPSPDPVTVWESADARPVPAAGLDLVVELDAPVFNASLAFDVLGTGTVGDTLTQDSAQVLTLSFSVTGTASVANIVVTAQEVKAARTYQVQADDAGSAATYGQRSQAVTAPWANREDAAAIASLIIGSRAERLPILQLTLMSETAVSSPRLVQQLARDLSDRVHVTEDETQTDADYYLQQIKHRVSHGGMLLTTDFWLEKVPEETLGLFIFDEVGAGFDDGVFGA
jgi:hypothetical protein